MKVLLDHHLKKQGILLWATMGSEGWLKLLGIPMLTFEDMGLPIDSATATCGVSRRKST